MSGRTGYTSFRGDPVSHDGRPAPLSGRVNHSRMNSFANRNSWGFEEFAGNRPGELYSTKSTDLDDIPSREHPHRSEPSQVLERRARGHNPAWHGAIRSSGSSPQIHDDSYASKSTPLVPPVYFSTYPCAFKAKLHSYRLARPWARTIGNTSRML